MGEQLVQDAIPRYANPDAVETIALPGPCRCPGSPHEHDEATYRTEIGAGELAALEPAGFWYSPGPGYSHPAFVSALVAYAVKAWTLVTGELDAKGEPISVPIEYASIALLDRPARDALVDAINGAYKARNLIPDEARLPNAPGARSRSSSRASASPNRRARRRS